MKPVADMPSPHLIIALASLAPPRSQPRNTTTRAPMKRSTRRFSLQQNVNSNGFASSRIQSRMAPFDAQASFSCPREIPGKGDARPFSMSATDNTH